MDTVAAAVQFN